MKKVLIVSALSLIIFGIINTLIYENTWSGCKYRFVLGILNGLVPFLVGTIVYHFTFKVLQSKIIYLNTLLGQIIFAIMISLTLAIVFVVMDSIFYGTGDGSGIKMIAEDTGFIVGVGATVSVIYYFVSRFYFRDSHSGKKSRY